MSTPFYDIDLTDAAWTWCRVALNRRNGDQLVQRLSNG